MDKKNEVTASVTGGVSVLGLFGVAFVILKLMGIIKWAWIWVLCPFWIELAILLAALVILGLFLLITIIITALCSRK